MKWLLLATFIVASLCSPPSTCDFAGFSAALQSIEDGINSIDYSASVLDFGYVQAKVQAIFQQQEPCLILAYEAVNIVEATAQVDGTTTCYYPNGTQEWLVDPCCNTELQYTQCCAPRDISFQNNLTFSSFNDDYINQCSSGNSVRQAVQHFLDYEAFHVPDCFSRNTFDTTSISATFATAQSCMEAVFGSPPCSSSSDCINGSICAPSGSCSVPENPFTYLTACFIESLDPTLVRFLRKAYNLTADSATTEVESHVMAQISVNGCFSAPGVQLPQYTTEAECLNSHGCNDFMVDSQLGCVGPFCAYCFTEEFCIGSSLVPEAQCTQVCSDFSTSVAHCSGGVCSTSCGGSACQTEYTCLQQGSCDDGGVGAGACLTSFIASDGGTVDCPPLFDQIRIGCKSQIYVTEQACTSAGYTWTLPATTAEECAAFGVYCAGPLAFWEKSAQSADECTLCGGTIENLAEWTPATWGPGRVLNLEYIQRNWTQNNSWGPVVNGTLLLEFIQFIIAKELIPIWKTVLQCVYLPLLNDYKQVVCACGTNSTDCFPSGSTTVQIGTGVAFSGLQSTTASSGVSVTVSDSAVSSSDDSANVKLSVVIDVASSSGRKRDTSSRVVNSQGTVVGQTVGSTYLFQSDATISGSGFTLCLDIDGSISVASGFTTADLGYSVSASDTVVALGLPSVNVTKYNICSSGLTQNGYYTPIMTGTQLSTGITGNHNNASKLGSTCLAAFVVLCVFLMFD